MLSITNKLTYEHFLEMERLERRFYSADFITPAEESYRYYLKYPRSTFAAVDGGTLAGFVNLFPVKEEVFAALMRGEYNDSSLTADAIASGSDDAPINMFLSCIAVAREYRDLGASMALLRAAIESYADIAPRAASIVADTVTADGRRFVEKLGFRFVCESGHASRVYVMPYADFCGNAALMRYGR